MKPIHGYLLMEKEEDVVHIFETFLNIYEKAYMSACLSLFAGSLMIAGACIDSSHHKHKKEEERE